MSSSRESDAKVDIIIDTANEPPEQLAGAAGDQGSTERLLRARGAAARTAAPPAGPSAPGDDADDDPPDDSPSPLYVWLSMLVRTVLSALHTCFSAVLFALYPIYVLVPGFVLEGLFRLVRAAAAWRNSSFCSRCFFFVVPLSWRTFFPNTQPQS